MTVKRYQRIRQNLEFIFSDIADLNTNAIFSDKNFKNISLRDIEHCVYLSNYEHIPLPETCIKELNKIYFIIYGASEKEVLNTYLNTDKFHTYKF